MLKRFEDYLIGTNVTNKLGKHEILPMELAIEAMLDDLAAENEEMKERVEKLEKERCAYCKGDVVLTTSQGDILEGNFYGLSEAEQKFKEQEDENKRLNNALDNLNPLEANQK